MNKHAARAATKAWLSMGHVERVLAFVEDPSLVDHVAFAFDSLEKDTDTLAAARSAKGEECADWVLECNRLELARRLAEADRGVQEKRAVAAEDKAHRLVVQLSSTRLALEEALRDVRFSLNEMEELKRVLSAALDTLGLVGRQVHAGLPGKKEEGPTRPEDHHEPPTEST